MATKEVLVDWLIGSKTKLINRDGDLDQGVLMNMDMEYLLAWWEAEFALTVYYLWYVKSKWEKDGLTFGLITTKKQRILQHNHENRNLCTISRYGWTWYTSCLFYWYDSQWLYYGDIDDDELSAPHGVGFVWCTILWDMYWAFIAQDGYDQTSIMELEIIWRLVMDGFETNWIDNVGFVEGWNYRGRYYHQWWCNECLIRAVFARRGVGAAIQELVLLGLTKCQKHS
jgi:hypothetical protein